MDVNIFQKKSFLIFNIITSQFPCPYKKTIAEGMDRPAYFIL